MRIATYNVENLFTRAKALNLDTWAEGKSILASTRRTTADRSSNCGRTAATS